MYRGYRWSVKFVHNRRKAKGMKLLPIEVSIHYKTTHYFPTGIHVLPSNWDGFRTVNHPLSIAYNQKLSKIEFEISSRINETEGKCSMAEVKLILGLGRVESFNDFIRSQIEKEEVSDTTKRIHRSALKVLDAFSPQLKFKDINSQFAHNVVYYLRAKGNKDTSIRNFITIAKKYLIIAENLGLFKGRNPLKGIRLNIVESEKEYLTIDELNKIEKYEGIYSDVRDMFLLSCYTGMAYIDIKNFKKESITVGKYKFIQSTRTKSKTGYYINLSLMFHGKALDVIERMEDKPSSYTRVYTAIQRIAKDCGINKKITFHVGRVTCATNLEGLGMSEQRINYIMGWKSKGMKSRYAKITREKIDAQLLEIFK